jgi:hypothetical protein
MSAAMLRQYLNAHAQRFKMWELFSIEKNVIKTDRNNYQDANNQIPQAKE